MPVRGVTKVDGLLRHAVLNCSLLRRLQRSQRFLLNALRVAGKCGALVADRLHHLTDCAGVVVGRHPDQDVYLSNVDQLAKKIIRKNAFFGQRSSSFPRLTP